MQMLVRPPGIIWKQFDEMCAHIERIAEACAEEGLPEAFRLWPNMQKLANDCLKSDSRWAYARVKLCMQRTLELLGPTSSHFC